MVNKTCCFTGHRPNKLPGGYDVQGNKELLWRLHDKVVEHINNGVTTFISGMAVGIDTYAALIVLRLKDKYPSIKLIAAVPCKNQHKKWPEKSQKQWQEIIDRCDDVYYVSKEEYTTNCMEMRNRWMVLVSKYVIAVWDGTPGGTGNCVKYAKKQTGAETKEITIIKP